MDDIKRLSVAALLEDRQASLDDEKFCEGAISLGVLYYSGGSVQKRADTNREIVIAIDAELQCRKVAQE